MSVEMRNRRPATPPEATRSTEEALIEKLDVFLLLIEESLARFEQYFQMEQGEKLRRNSATLLRTYLAFYLSLVHEHLRVVKNHVLTTSFTNLDYLHRMLDDQYRLLFSGDAAPVDELETLTQRILTTIHYFEEKLGHIDAFISSHTPSTPYDDSKFGRFRFHNFNKALKEAEHQYLHYYQLPLCWRENRYIVYGYRFTLKHSSMLRLIFSFGHNETGNIWTHMVGFAVVAYLAFVHFPSTAAYAGNSARDNVVMYIFLLAAAKCMVLLVLWHTYLCFANVAVRNRFACVDYTGITVLISCSVVAVQYTALHEYPKMMTSMVLVLALCGIGGFVFNWLPLFDRPDYKAYRIAFFIGLACVGSSTMVCKLLYEGSWSAAKFFAPLFYKSFSWYWLGIVFYGSLFPERWRYDVAINDEPCNHSDVLLGETCGEEDAKEIEVEIMQSELRPESKEAFGAAGEAEEDTETGEERKYREILERHFPLEPPSTPYRGDFLLLWWVDYACSLHNLWHVCVVLGIVGHYFCVVTMFESVHT